MIFNMKKQILFITLSFFFCFIKLFGIYSVGSKLPDKLGVYYNWEEYKINLRIEDRRFYVYFLNEKDEIITPPVSGVSLRIETRKKVLDRRRPQEPARRREEIFLVLRMAPENNTLTNPRHAPPPYIYWVNLTLLGLKNDQETALTTFERTLLTQ